MKSRLMSLTASVVMSFWALAGEPLVYGPFGTEDDVAIDKVEPTIFAGVGLTFGEIPAVAEDCVAVYRKSNDALCGLGKVVNYRGVPQLTMSMQVKEGTEVYFKGWQKSGGMTFDLVASLNGGAFAETVAMPESGSVDALLVLSTAKEEPPEPPESPIREDDVVIDKVEPTIFDGVALTFGEAPMAVGDVVGMYRALDGALCGYGEAFDFRGEVRMTLSVQVKEGTEVCFKGWQKSSGTLTNLVASLNGGAFAETVVMPESGSVDAVLALSTAKEEPPEPPESPIREDDVVIDKVEPTIFDGVALTFGEAPMAVGDVVGMYRALDGALCGYGEAFDFMGEVRMTLSVQVKEGTEVCFKGWQKSSGTLTNLVASLNGGAFAETVAMPESGSVDAVLALRTGEADPPPVPPEPEVYAIAYELGGGENAAGNPASYTTNDLPIALAAPTREGYDFAGWAPSGEVAVGTTGDLTFTATWTKHEEPPIPPPDQKRLVEELTEVDKNAFPAMTYDGYLCGNGAGGVEGTIQVKAAKAKFNKNTGKMTTKLTIGIQLADGSKKVSISGEYDLDAGGVQSFAAKGRTVSLTIGANGMTGTFEGCAIEGVSNVFVLKDYASRIAALMAEEAYVGSYNIFAAAGAFTVTVAKKGKVKLSGALFDGTKVSASAQLLVGDGSACIPLVAAKQKLAFAVWFGAEKEMSVVGLEDAIVGPGANMNIAGADNAFQVDVEGLSDVMTENGIEPLAEFMPQGLSVVPNGKKWLVANGAKAGKIKYDAASGEVWDDKESANPSGLSLSYSAKAGTFTGSFKVYGIVGGKLKSYTAKVTGVLVDGRGYGFASISKVGGAAVLVAPER